MGKNTLLTPEQRQIVEDAIKVLEEILQKYGDTDLLTLYEKKTLVTARTRLDYAKTIKNRDTR